MFMFMFAAKSELHPIRLYELRDDGIINATFYCNADPRHRLLQWLTREFLPLLSAETQCVWRTGRRSEPFEHPLLLPRHSLHLIVSVGEEYYEKYWPLGCCGFSNKKRPLNRLTSLPHSSVTWRTLVTRIVLFAAIFARIAAVLWNDVNLD